MQSGLEKVPQLRGKFGQGKKAVVFLNRYAASRFSGKIPKMFENKRFKVIKRDKPEGILHYESFNNNVCADLPVLVLQMLFLHCKCLNRIRHTHGSNWQQGIEQIIAIV